MHELSIVIPTLNEYLYITNHQAYFKSLIKQGHEIIIVDGGSVDGTVESVQKIGCKCLSTKASRGYQLHAGACASTHNVLVFLHADTLLPPTVEEIINTSLSNSNSSWGRFNVTFSKNNFIFKILAWFMNKRSCLTGIVTGDHTLFIKRDTYFNCGGFSDIPIMEDIEISRRLKKHSDPICLSNSVITSSRKWEKQGIAKTILMMWALRAKFYFGVSAEKIVEQYYSQ